MHERQDASSALSGRREDCKEKQRFSKGVRMYTSSAKLIAQSAAEAAAGMETNGGEG